MTSFAHIKLDFYDDPTILKGRKDIPEYVTKTKLASKEEREKFGSESFALIMITEDGTLHPKFPIHTVGDTWLSLQAFEKNAHKLPLEAQETAAFYLQKAAKLWSGKDNCTSSLLSKVASQGRVTTNVVRVHKNIEYLEDTVKLASSKFSDKVDKLDDSEFGIVVGTERRYPLHNPEYVKKASSWFEENHQTLQPRLRKMFADNLIKAACAHDVIVDTDAVFKYAGTDYAPDFPVALQLRKNFTVNEDELHLLDDLLEKRAGLEPKDCARVLESIDKRLGLDKHWNKHFPDPYESVFSLPKLADYSYNSDTGDVSGSDLREYVKRDNFRESLESYVSKEVIDELEQNPVEVFNSLPKPEKELIMGLMKE